MGLREIDDAGKSSDGAWGDGYDYSDDLRAGGWDYAANGAARAVDWASELDAQPSLAEVKADGAAAAQTAASTAQQVASAASAVHAVDAASTARAEYKAASDVGSAASAVETSATEMGAAASVTEAVTAEVAKEAGIGASAAAKAAASGSAGANLTALESGIRASKASAIKAKAGKAAAIASELMSGNDLGEGMSNAATGEAKAYAQRKISRKAARAASSRISKARAARAARKAAKAAGNAGTVAAGKSSAASAKAVSSTVARSAQAVEGAAAGAVKAKGAGRAVKVARSLFKPLPPLSKIAPKIAIGAGGAATAVLPIIVLFLVLVVIFTVIGGAAGIGGNEAKKTSTGSLSGNEQLLAQALRAYDLDEVHIAAIMGNFACESSCNPKVVQYGFGYDGIDQDDYPPELIDNGQCGYGLAQWTYPSRSRGLVNLAATLGKHSGDMDVQVKYLFEGYGEAEEFGPYLDSFKARADIDDATRYFHEVFENSADDESRIQKRVDEAKRIYNALVGGGGNDVVSAARSQIGSYYYWAHEGEIVNGHVTFDCSGLVKWCYDKAGKTGLEHWSVGIMRQSTIISHDEAQPGDIVGWGGSIEGCYHVGIYIGDDKVIDACGPSYWTDVPSQYTTQEHSIYFYGEPMFARYGG